jgi:hypothetical protein
MNHGPYVLHEFGEVAEAYYSAHLGWLTAAVYSSIPWPQDDVRVAYDGEDYFLRGVRERGGHQSAPAITMRCSGDTINAVLAKMYRFASILGWFKRGYVDVSGYITSSHAVLYSEQSNSASVLAGGPHGFDCNYLPLIRDDSTRRALAFWREGLRLRNVHIGYAFLSFFKVVESQFGKSADRVSWIASAIPKLDGDAAKRVLNLSAHVSDVGKHIYDSGRCAIAHAQFADGRGDPDVPEDRVRLREDLVIVEALARNYISEVLQVPDEMSVYRFRNRLEPLSTYIPVQARDKLKAKQHVSRRSVGLNWIMAGLAHWPHAPVQELSKLGLRVIAIRDGVVFVCATNQAGNIVLEFALDVPAGKAHIDIENCKYRRPQPGESPDDAIAVVNFRKQVIGNGRMELWLPDGGRVDFEVVIPVNIDIGGTWRLMDKEIDDLKQLSQRT